MDPLSLLCRLATSVPPPRFYTVKYAGVLASASPWRVRVTPPPRRTARPEPAKVETLKRPGTYRPWAELLKRTFDVDVLECPTHRARRRRAPRDAGGARPARGPRTEAGRPIRAGARRARAWARGRARRRRGRAMREGSSARVVSQDASRCCADRRLEFGFAPANDLCEVGRARSPSPRHARGLPSVKGGSGDERAFSGCTTPRSSSPPLGLSLLGALLGLGALARRRGGGAMKGAGRA
jgi:hypothetical protein